MKTTAKGFHSSIVLMTIFAILLMFSSTALAETDVTSKIKLNKSALTYDLRTKTSSLNVSLANLSQDVLLTPIKVVIDSISGSGVTVANADGTTEDGKPYFDFTDAALQDGQLNPTAVSGARTFKFTNPTRARFTFTTRTIGYLPTPDSTIERATLALEENHIQAFVLNVPSYEQTSMANKLSQLDDNALLLLADLIKNSSIISQTDKHMKMETVITYPDGATKTLTYDMILENGA